MENPRFTPSAEELHAAEKLLKTRSFPELERLSEAYIEKITGKNGTMKRFWKKSVLQ